VAQLRRELADQPQGEARRETRQLRGVELSAVCEVVAATYGVDETELKRCGSRHPARAALAYLAREYTEATNADLAPLLGVSRPENVPNLTRRFRHCLETDSATRKQYQLLVNAVETHGGGD
jgi:hypothetical protein